MFPFIFSNKLKFHPNRQEKTTRIPPNISRPLIYSIEHDQPILAEILFV